MIVSVPTPYSTRLHGFNMDEEPIIEVDDIEYLMDTTLSLPSNTRTVLKELGVEANFAVHSCWRTFKEISDDKRMLATLSGRILHESYYSSGLHTSNFIYVPFKEVHVILRNFQICNECWKGRVLKLHPENHTIDSAAILHELYNDMGKLGLE
ncbi:hypothetical protein Tco_0102769 [Tanacetum coccineum]